jgi:hypothetical protein
MNQSRPTTHEKAFRINVDAQKHGTFAEIGAGQEVVRWFFHVGGAAGTVAKTISAYDMAISDAIYGPTDRYVSRQRLRAMLDHEYDSLLERLHEARGAETTFFVYANSIATKSYSRHQDGHGWMGIRFQHKPHAIPSQILIHARMLDTENVREQEAVGILGVNLIHGAFYHHEEPGVLIKSLLDGLGRERMEVDLIDFSGPCFAEVDNRLMSLALVEGELTDAAMFKAEGEMVLPSDVLYKKAALVHRGTFRPITNTTMDMLERARSVFRDAEEERDNGPVVILEMTLRNLLAGDRVDHADFLARADTLGVLGHDVMVSNFGHYHSAVTYLRRHTSLRIMFAMGAPNLGDLFQERYYSDLAGGILEAMGRLFNGDVRLAVYPFQEPETMRVSTVENLEVPEPLRDLYRHLVVNGRIVGIRDVPADRLHMFSGAVRDWLQSGDPRWETMVPAPVVSIIKSRGLFGYSP